MEQFYFYGLYFFFLDHGTETQKALEELDNVQSALDNLNEIASEEILKVEQKYNQQRKPYFEQRSELIKKITNFWVTVFINHPQISSIMEEEEEECLHYLTKLEIEEFEDIKAGYKIKFTFDVNPYFENTEIFKEYNWSGADPRCSSTPIQWKPGKQKQLMNGAGKNGAENRSFFKWLCEESDPMADDIAEVIKDDIWPNPLQYYLAPEVEAADEEGCEEDDDGGLTEEYGGYEDGNGNFGGE
uniref:Uncharacterized protein n=3 Tax=Meloidogyne enterolobii TaxID=390850 RepID=A0A6V7U030_MELEN|nr:unnamed protein product [Meloidogyne enterolobii]